MNPDEQAKALRGYFEQWRETVALGRVYIAEAGPLPGYPVLSHACFRLLLPLRGYRRQSLAYGGALREIELTTGEALFGVRRGWFHTDWMTECTLLSIVYFETYTRLLYIETEDGPGEPVPVPRYVYHTSRPLDETGLHLLGALNGQAGREGLDQALLVHLVEGLVNRTEVNLRENRPVGGDKAFHRFCEIRSYLAEHCHRPINRDSVGRAFGLSPGYISRLFGRFAGGNFNDYLTQLRVSHAAHLLGQSDGTVGEVAEQSGFASAGYFIKVFKKAFHTTPEMFRQSRRGK